MCKINIEKSGNKVCSIVIENQIESFEKLTIPVDFFEMWLKPRKCAKLTLKNHEIKFAPLFEKLTIPVDFLVNKYSNLNRKSMWLKPRKCAKLTLKNHEIKFAPLLSMWLKPRKKSDWILLRNWLYQSISWSTSIQIWILNPFEKLNTSRFLGQQVFKFESMWLKTRKCAKLTLKNHEMKFAPLLSKNQIESFWETDYTSRFLGKYSNLNRNMWLKPRKCAKLTLKNHEIKFAPLLSKNQIESFWETDYTSRFLGQQVFKFE